MDNYDEILKLFYKKDCFINSLTYLIDLIQKKVQFLTPLEFNNCMILTLAIWNDDFKDMFLSQGKNAHELEGNRKKMLQKILQKEFIKLDS